MSTRLSPVGGASIQAQLDHFTTASASNAQPAVPGLVFAFANEDAILFSGASGVRSLGGSEPAAADATVWLASCSKVICAIAAMQLVEQGLLDLDAPVDDELPEVALAEILIDNETGETRKPVTKITLRMLLTHTAGFSYSFFHSGVRDWCKARGGLGFGGDQSFFTAPLVCEPGTAFNYSTGMDWVGILVERISGVSLGEYFSKNIFLPLGVDDIAFDVSEAMRSRLLGMHARSADGVLTARDHLPSAHRLNVFHSGGGGCYGSATSFLKVIQIFVNEGRGANGAQILKPETIAAMLIDQVACKLPGTLDVSIPSALPAITNPIPDLQPGTTKGWGISFLRMEEGLKTGRGAGSVYWAGLANVYYWIDPEKKIVGIIMAQILPFFDAKVLAAWEAVETAAYSALES